MKLNVFIVCIVFSILDKVNAGFCDTKFVSGYYCDDGSSKYCKCSFFKDDCDKKSEEWCQEKGCNFISGKCINYDDYNDYNSSNKLNYVFVLTVFVSTVMFLV